MVRTDFLCSFKVTNTPIRAFTAVSRKGSQRGQQSFPTTRFPLLSGKSFTHTPARATRIPDPIQRHQCYCHSSESSDEIVTE